MKRFIATAVATLIFGSAAYAAAPKAVNKVVDQVAASCGLPCCD